MTLNYSLTLVHTLGGDIVIVLSPPMLLDFNDFTFGPHTFKWLEITTQRLDLVFKADSFLNKYL